MEKKRRRVKLNLLILIGIVVFYIVLLLCLLVAERSSGSSSIRTLGDAFWYSLVTLSTVGYGDITPVTPFGRIIGVIFLLLSMGILVTLFGTVMSFLTGEALPLLYLSFHKRKNWYYFADFGTESNTLAQDIIKEDSDAVIIFGEKKSEQSESPEYPCLFLNSPLTRIIARKKGVGSKCRVLLMKENDIGRNSRAVNLTSLPVIVYASTENGLDSLPGHINFFHRYDCCARHYWRDFPLKHRERNIVLIGFGSYGRALLKRAILTNVIVSTQHVNYHIFGDAEKFLAIHNHLGDVFAIDEESKTRDSLFFHKEPWTGAHDILEQSDRIIIADDDEGSGWNTYWQIRRYYCFKGELFLRSNRLARGVNYFGTDKQIYTAREILKTQLNEAAIALNELYRKETSGKTLDWKSLDDFLRQSKIAAADHLLIKMRILLNDDTIKVITPENAAKAYFRYLTNKATHPIVREEYRKLEHLRWMRFYAYNNWGYGTFRDDMKRRHPMYTAYENLTEEQKMQREYSWELLNSLSGELRDSAETLRKDLEAADTAHK